MADARLAPVLRHLRRLAGTLAVEDQPDSTLLGRLASHRDPDAFEALVRRHGPLVWRVCRRILGREQDAEDTFQATFLALARRPQSIRKPESLASFLHGTAYRIARRVLDDQQRRRAVPPGDTAATARDPADEAAWRELGRLVEAEVHALPERLRLVLLLCYWEGLTNEEAARRLGWPSGTVKTRLAKARMLLHDRLARRGVALPAGLTALLLAPGAGGAAVPSLRMPRAEAAALLTWKKVGLALLLAAGTVLVGVAAPAHRGPAGAEEERNAGPEQARRQPPAHADLQGDPLPRRALARLGTVRFRLGGLGYACAWSPDGKTLAAGSADHTLHLFDAATGEPIRRLRGGQFHVTSLAYSPDGRSLASGGADNSLIVWDPATGRVLRQFRAPEGPVWSLAFTRDGKGLVSGGGTAPLLLWDPATGKEERRFTGHKEGVRSVVVSPDGRTIASAGGGEIRLWETATGRMIRRQTGQKGPIRALAFSPDGKRLASGS
jgi:RNA polymerase sigma factor (sigma-70 family)